MTIDKSLFLYSVEREYPVSIDALWQAWADAAALEQWYSPTMLKVVPGSVVNEPEVGGRWSVAVDVSAFGQADACFYGRFVEVQRNQLMVHTMHFTTDAAEFAAKDETAAAHHVVVEFEDRGEGRAWCKFSQFGHFPGGDIERTREGMTSYFDNLEAFLTRS